MKTKRLIEYKAAPYGHIATIPEGTPVTEAKNLPEKGQFWVQRWEGMDEKAESWQRNYGFLVSQDEVS